MNTKDMTILITGATGGIGRSFAKQAFNAGANLVLVARNEKSLKALQLELIASNPKASNEVHYFAADISCSDARQNLVSYIARLQTPVNVLINNAGINHFSLLKNQSEERIHSLLLTNTVSPILLTKALIPQLSLNTEAQIINVGSTFGSIGYPGYAAYSASKFAIRGFSEALQRELSGSTITVKHLSPRATKTALNTSHVENMNNELKVAMDSPEHVAQKLMKLLLSRDTYMAIGWPERLFAFINKLFPSLVGNAISKQLPVITQYATISSLNEQKAKS